MAWAGMVGLGRRVVQEWAPLSHCGANKAKMREIMRGPTTPKRIHEG